jgi:hypothetical protein
MLYGGRSERYLKFSRKNLYFKYYKHADSAQVLGCVGKG